MTNFEFLLKYQKLQEGIMCDYIFDLGFASIGSSKIDKSMYWNLALVDQLLKDEQLNILEEKFKSLDRNPTIYFENRQDLESLASFLEAKEYKKSFEDSWQFWTGKEVDTKHFESIKKVSSEEELKIFLETFINATKKMIHKIPMENWEII